MKKRLLSIVVVLAMVIGMMPMTVGADPSDGPVLSDENYIKLIVDTGGKGDISLNEYAEEEFKDLISMRPGEPNVIYVDKEELVLAEEWNIDVDDLLDAVDLPQVEGYHNGRMRDSHAYTFGDPNAITNYEQYENAIRELWYTKLSEKAVNDELTVHAIWFKVFDKMTVEVTPPSCGDILGEDTVAQVKAPSGEHWHINPDYPASWRVWDEEYECYELFEGEVKGNDDIVADMEFENNYGYCINPNLKPEDITVKYTDWQGKKVNGSVDRIVSLEDEIYGTGEFLYSEIGVKVKVQHVPGPVEKTEIVKPTCTKDGSHREIIKCKKCSEIISDKKVVDKAIGHNWGPWKVVKKPTATKPGLKQRVCKNDSSHVQKKSIPAKGQNVLLVTMKSKGKNKLNVSWTKASGAKGYDIFFSRCNRKEKKSKPKLIKTIKGNKKFSWTKKGLKKNTAYKAYVKAWTKKGGKKKYIAKSPKAHVFTNGSAKGFTNPKSVKVKKTKLSVKAKKSCKIRSKVKKLKGGKKLIPTRHTARLRYASSNKAIVKVSKAGKVKGIAKGTCYVYVFATNGVYKKIKVKVK